MKRILFILSLIILTGSVFGQDTTSARYNDQRGNLFMKVPNVPAWKIDGYNYAIRGTDTLVRVRNNGAMTAEELNILPNGSNMRSQIAAIVNLTRIRQIRFSSDSARAWIVNDSIDFQGRTITFENGGIIKAASGYVKIKNAIIDAPDEVQIFDTTVVLDGATVRGKNGYLSVKWWGAKGDALTDDTKAIQSGLNAEYSLIKFPSGGYRTSSPVVLDWRSSIDMGSQSYIASSADIGIVIGYDGSGSPTVAEKANKFYRINIIRQSQSDWSVDSSYGVYARNILNSQVDIVRSQSFTVGLQLTGINMACAYSEYRLGYIVNNMYGVRLSTIGDDGYTNQNEFYGGRIAVTGSTNPGKRRYGIWVGNAGKWLCTNNTFYSPSVELNDPLGIPIWVQNGARNLFLHFRKESGSDTTAFITSSVDTRGNKNFGNQIIAGRVNSTNDKVVDQSGFNLDENSSNILMSKTQYNTVWEVNNITDYISYAGPVILNEESVPA